MSNVRMEAKFEHVWSFLLSVLFIGLVVIATYILSILEVDYSRLGVFEFIVVGLAAFRMTRLMVYDSIMLFFRDFFNDKTNKLNKKEGLYEVTRSKPKYGLRRKLHELFGCPWCAGVWITLFVVFLFFVSPYTWLFLVVLALAGISSFIQLTVNLIGWNAEGRKKEVMKMK